MLDTAAIPPASSATSNARLLSALRVFYAQLVRQQVIEADPAALLEAPHDRRTDQAAVTGNEDLARTVHRRAHYSRFW